MNNEKIISSKKRGRKPKNQTNEYVLNKRLCRFFVGLSCEKNGLCLIFGKERRQIKLRP
jgi:hypothetical protein